ncbi:capsule biosynthesis protein [Halomonas organivorans]|uniref:Capsular polysaccharide export protein n=1 Tax=Halomonas organivorans TaxID=257772 RepID=A0A7W5C0Y8_9GAMM|nr:capsular biosynthesis protein [Halomonas organivorans]MBB3142642.1 capsular polysaccharide export protein [Halomonas organivorans]
MTSSRRSFLFLQGVCSPFFQQLGQRLTEDGHRVTKVHFNGGDLAYWSPKSGKSHLFRGKLSELPAFLDTLRQQCDVTDQVIFGDERPVHRTAIRDARRQGVRNQILEEGYFRPFWVTVEREGVNGHSLLPLDADWFRDAAAALPAPEAPRRFRSPFRLRAGHDVLYHLAGLGNPLLAPHYRNHAPVTAPIEYAGYLKRLTQLRWWKRRDAARIARLVEARTPFYVLPLQLNGDAQIRHHSPFSNMEEVIECVMASFARSAPSDSLLCIKNHPLDMGLEDYAGKIRRLAQRYDVAERIVYLESGDLNALLAAARGTVTVNSTSGIVALEHRCPTIALSQPIYRLPGLTFEGDLDDFWRHATPPDDTLFRCFHKVVMHTTQLNGGYYCRTGMALAIDNVARRLEAETSPLEALL